jgi:prolyl oligopeptidase
LEYVDFVASNKFLATYLHDVQSHVKVFDTQGQFLHELALPDPGSIYGFSSRQDDTEAFYFFTNFTTPGAVYRYDTETNQSFIFRQPQVDFRAEDYITRQVFYPSKDGTQIPMFITHKKGLKLDGTNPTYLYGYGGYNISLVPAFSITNLVWMELGGVYAQANLRGGGEYGKAWHEAGMKLNRQNVFDDFIAAAEWLIENNYTQSSRLGIGGGSNGGLLVGACMTQRPDLFGACLPNVGVLDMLRFHLFTVGRSWISDYGSPDDPDEFKALLAYSPYHNLKPGTAYPPTLIMTGDHDDRVFPAHSFKFAAALQAAQAGPAPTLIRIETRAGHGMGKPTSKFIEEAADRWAFLVENLGME